MKYFERFKNVGTLLSIASLVGLILIQFGLEIDLEWLDTTVKLILNLGIVLGILNNSTTPGMDLPFTKEGEK